MHRTYKYTLRCLPERCVSPTCSRDFTELELYGKPHKFGTRTPDVKSRSQVHAGPTGTILDIVCETKRLMLSIVGQRSTVYAYLSALKVPHIYARSGDHVGRHGNGDVISIMNEFMSPIRGWPTDSEPRGRCLSPQIEQNTP